jgi:aspartate/methionine/tyrosine aminotransferase
MQTAKRLEGIGEYYFSRKLREIDELNKQGKNIINLGIGSPDLPPHPSVIDTLKLEAEKPNSHGYQNYKGSPILRKAIAGWYQQWYAVTLNPDTEILPLIGSKEGIMHICMTYINEGDIVLLPNPGYPTYRSAARLAGGNLVDYHLQEKNNWFPDFDELRKLIPAEFAAGKQRAILFVNYPHMPTGQLPTMVFFEKLISFAREYNLLVIHDNPYSFILNEHPISLLSVEGSMDHVIELNSLSKSQNMAGWRVGMLVGAKERIEEVLRFKSNMDSGMFLPVQLAAAKALELPRAWYHELNKIYSRRRNKVFELLDLLHCEYSKNQAGLFVWAKVPPKAGSGYNLSDQILYGANVFLTPGGIFGDAGELYIRISLCCPEGKIEESIERIKQFSEIKNPLHV